MTSDKPSPRVFRPEVTTNIIKLPSCSRKALRCAMAEAVGGRVRWATVQSGHRSNA